MKQQNPIKGYLKCPVCSSTATAHMCGEGKLLETGEPPKNSRNLGLHYYKCPECGNQQISNKGSEFVLANMVADKSQLEAVEVTEALTESLTVGNDDALGVVTAPTYKPLEVKENEALNVEVVAEQVTETVTESPAPVEEKKEVLEGELLTSKPRHRWLAIGGLACFAVFVYLQFKPKVSAPSQANQGVNYGE